MCYRGACRRVDVHDALDVRPSSVDGGVQGEAGLVHAQVGTASVHDLPLQVNLHLGTHR